MSYHLALLLSTLLCTWSVVHSQLNDTNATITTTQAGATSTAYYSTIDPIYDTLPLNTNETFMPTPSPTDKPSNNPTTKPTAAPTVNIPEGQSKLLKLIMKLCGVAEGWIEDNKESLLQICCDATGADDCGDDTKIALSTIAEVSCDDDATGRRLLATGVSVQFRISTKNPRSVVAIESAVNSGSFVSQFSAAISENYDNVEVDDNVELVDEGVGDGDEFLGAKDPTFAELIASPYILLGVVCIVVGTIWLLFLRSTIENKYPSYLAQPPSATTPQQMAVEMVQQTSASSAPDTAADDGEPNTNDPDGEVQRKLANKQELEAAWNDSDAEPSGDDPDETRL